MRREDVLDLALRHHTRDEVLARAKAIQEKQDADWSYLPAFLARSLAEPLDLADWQKLKPLDALYIVLICNGRRANEILLQRVLIRKAGATSGRLITIARATFAHILQLTRRHDIAAMFYTTFTYLMCTHGVRSAGILAVELLKQEMLPSYPEDPLLPRSQTIQDLAIFAAWLGAVDPSDGWYSICEQGQRVITKILDRILSPEPARARQNGDGEGGCNHHPEQLLSPHGQVLPTQMEIDAPQYNFGAVNGTIVGGPDLGYGMGTMDAGTGVETPLGLGQDGDFMRWLDNMDWGRM